MNNTLPWIDYDIPYIDPQYSQGNLMSYFDNGPYESIAVIDEFQHLIGHVSQDDHLDVSFDNLSSKIIERRLILSSDINIFELIHKMDSENTNIVFIQENDHYLGAITNNSLMNYMRKEWFQFQNGSIIMLEVAVLDYNMTDIVRILSSESIQILSFWTNKHQNLEKISINIHVDSHDLKNCIGVFENYNYKVLSTYNEEGYNQYLKNRYESLIHYLDI